MKCEYCGLEMFIDRREERESGLALHYKCKNKNCTVGAAGGVSSTALRFLCCKKPLVSIKKSSYQVEQRAEDYFEELSDKLYITCPICQKESVFDIKGKNTT